MLGWAGLGEQGTGSPFRNACLGPGYVEHARLCPQEYERASKVDQFVTRFLLRETVSQLQALQSSLEGASDTLEVQARGPRYGRCLAGHCLHIPGPSASITFRSCSIPEPIILVLGQGGQEGVKGGGWLTSRLGLSVLGSLLCSTQAQPCAGAPALGLWVWEQCADPPLLLGQTKAVWRYRAGPMAAGGQGAGPRGASVGRPPGLLAPQTQVLPVPAPPLPLSSS